MRNNHEINLFKIHWDTAGFYLHTRLYLNFLQFLLQSMTTIKEGKSHASLFFKGKNALSWKQIKRGKEQVPIRLTFKNHPITGSYGKCLQLYTDRYAMTLLEFGNSRLSRLRNQSLCFDSILNSRANLEGAHYPFLIIFPSSCHRLPLFMVKSEVPQNFATNYSRTKKKRKEVPEKREVVLDLYPLTNLIEQFRQQITNTSSRFKGWKETHIEYKSQIVLDMYPLTKWRWQVDKKLYKQT